MSTILNTNGAELTIPALHDIKNFKCAVIYAGWNPEITHSLRDSAVDTFRKAGVADDSVYVFEVPGTVELVNAAAAAMNYLPKLDAIIVIGCVIRGDTPHFDYVCQIVADGVARLNAKGKTSVIFGVLTVDDMQQALDRAGGKLGNKGGEAAVAAIDMANYHLELSKDTMNHLR